MYNKIAVPAHGRKDSPAELRQTLTALLRFRNPDETGIVHVEPVHNPLRPDLIAQVTVRRRDERIFYTNCYRFFADGGAEVEHYATRNTESISGGWVRGVLAILRDAKAAAEDYARLTAESINELEFQERVLDTHSR